MFNELGIHGEFISRPNSPEAGAVPDRVGFAAGAPAARGHVGILRLGYDGQPGKGGIAPVVVHNGLVYVAERVPMNIGSRQRWISPPTFGDRWTT